jgi:hypothetical protein
MKIILTFPYILKMIRKSLLNTRFDAINISNKILTYSIFPTARKKVFRSFSTLQTQEIKSNNDIKNHFKKVRLTQAGLLSVANISCALVINKIIPVVTTSVYPGFFVAAWFGAFLGLLRCKKISDNNNNNNNSFYEKSNLLCMYGFYGVVTSPIIYQSMIHFQIIFNPYFVSTSLALIISSITSAFHITSNSSLGNWKNISTKYIGLWGLVGVIGVNYSKIVANNYVLDFNSLTMMYPNVLGLILGAVAYDYHFTQKLMKSYDSGERNYFYHASKYSSGMITFVTAYILLLLALDRLFQDEIFCEEYATLKRKIKRKMCFKC